MADEAGAGTNQNTGTEQATGTLLTEGGNANAGAKDQQTEANASRGQAATNQSETKDGEAAGSKDGENTEQKPAGAPEKYEFKMPDGIKLDETQVKAFEPIARKLNLSQEAAQELVDMQVDFLKRTAQAQTEAWTTQINTWKDEIKGDPELGGKNLDATLNAAKAALKEFGDEGTIKFLDDYGMGYHPGLIRLLAKVGKAMGEDTFKNGNGNGGEEDTLEARAQRMFPNSLKK